VAKACLVRAVGLSTTDLGEIAMNMFAATVGNLINELFCALDGSDYDKVTACFAPEGHWVRQGKVVQGWPAIKSSLLGARPITLTTIHAVTNFYIAQNSPSSANARFYLTVYRHDSKGSGVPPYAVPVPSAIGLCEVDFMFDGSRWLIQHLATGPYAFTG